MISKWNYEQARSSGARSSEISISGNGIGINSKLLDVTLQFSWEMREQKWLESRLVVGGALYFGSNLGESIAILGGGERR